MAAKCKLCGRTLITTMASTKCVNCGHPMGTFQIGKTAFTKRGARRLLAEEVSIDPGWDWHEVERLALLWMQTHGYRDAKLTPPGSDGGIDIVAKKAIGQVKAHAKHIGFGEIQRTYGIAHAVGKKALFFSKRGFPPMARAWARAHDVELYVFPPVTRLK